MSQGIAATIHNLLEGRDIESQVDELLEWRAPMKRIGAFSGIGAGGGALAGYIHARRKGLRGRRALRGAGRGAALGGLAGAGLGAYTEYNRSVATKMAADLESRFKKHARETAEEFDARIQKRYEPLEKMGRAAASGRAKWTDLFKGRGGRR